MATEIDGAPVETAPVSSTPAPAAPESSAVVTSSSSTPSTAELLADAVAEFRTHYETPAEAAARAEQAAEAAPAPGDTPPAPEVQPATVAPPEDEPTPPGELPKQVRPRMTAPEDIAIAGIQRARGCTFAEAAKILFAGTAPTTQQTATGEQTPAPAQPAPAAPPASQTIQSQIDALAAEMKTDRETDNYLNPEYAEKQERLADLRNELRFVKSQESQEAAARQQNQAEAARRADDEHVAAAKREFPSLRTANSPLIAAVASVEAEWQNSPDKAGRLDRSDRTTLVVREAAERLATQMVNAGTHRTIDQALASLKAPAATPAAATAPAAAPGVVPPAAPQPSRRVTAAAGSRGQARDDQPSSLNAALASFDTAKEGNALLRQLYGDAPLML